MQVAVFGTARSPHIPLVIISVTVQLWIQVFWVMSVYFKIRNTLPKSGTFLLGHPIYIYYLAFNFPNLSDSKKTKMTLGANFVEKKEAHILYSIRSSAKFNYFGNNNFERSGCILWVYLLFYAHCFLYTKSRHDELHGAITTRVIYNDKHAKPRVLLHGNILRSLCFHLRFLFLKKDTKKATWI